MGTGYIALFNYCFAKKNGGQFILRVEDTDQVRSTRESEEAILSSLRWLGLSWDEGPDCGGPHGPYRQSERSALYEKHAQELLDKGHAFKCFCTPERLTEMRRAQQKSGAVGYDGYCMGLSEEEVAQRVEQGEPHVIRMKVPRDGVCTVDDVLRGSIEIAWERVDMQVLVKSDGMPTYHLANVVDDHHMGITHVLRGEEWINSAPKHLLLYEYFGWEPPVLCHLPLLRNPDRSKLSKRKNPTSILYYERMGFLPEAIVNYLGRMAWSMPDESEKFTIEQMIDHFELDRISLGGPIFDIDKLTWLNGLYIRDDLDEQEFAQRVVDWALNRDRLMEVVPLIKSRTHKLSDLGPMTAFLFAGLLDLSAEQLVVKKLTPDEARKVLTWGMWRLDGLTAFDAEAISENLRHTAEMMDLKLRLFLAPFFVAISGQAVSTPLFETMAFLGRDLCRARLRQAIETLGGISRKEQKRWEKELKAAETVR